MTYIATLLGSRLFGKEGRRPLLRSLDSCGLKSLAKVMHQSLLNYSRNVSKFKFTKKLFFREKITEFLKLSKTTPYGAASKTGMPIFIIVGGVIWPGCISKFFYRAAAIFTTPNS